MVVRKGHSLYTPTVDRTVIDKIVEIYFPGNFLPDFVVEVSTVAHETGMSVQCTAST